ncbi:hypothetical protein EJ04DRAFT_142525 [Polyplosphaeria fusca]|uniref:Uncharacterized protein n=1 Tax=Polyplosphaeria fusca TaxID=682080 RepID=A0A9P4R4F6_9PLEO|nr:hypothetical protein EJ04DRAFT_142525 [Polyplosphaeria fusca]
MSRYSVRGRRRRRRARWSRPWAGRGRAGRPGTMRWRNRGLAPVQSPNRYRCRVHWPAHGSLTRAGLIQVAGAGCTAPVLFLSAALRHEQLDRCWYLPSHGHAERLRPTSVRRRRISTSSAGEGELAGCVCVHCARVQGV